MKQTFVLTLILIYLCSFGETVTSITSGDWNNPATWDISAIPGSGDDVIIASGHNVVLSTVSSINSLEIQAANTTSIGVLTLNTGAYLTTSSDTDVLGSLIINDGTFDAGNSSGDKLTVNGSLIGNSCNINIMGGNINISRYFALKNGSTFSMSGGVMNVNSAGGSSSTDIFSVPSATTFNMTGGSINILNGNLGLGVAFKLNPSTSEVSGGSIYFLNTRGYDNTTFIMDIDVNNIVCDIGEGKELTIENMEASTTGFSCNDLEVSSGVLSINAGSGLTISGSLTVSSRVLSELHVNSDSGCNGSLILEGTVNASITCHRYIEEYINNEDGWHVISCPVENMSISGSDFEPGNSDDLFCWDESQNMWLNFKVPSNNIENFISGKGYLVSYNTTEVKSFTGVPTTDNVQFSNLSLGLGEGWHLLGNPYSSALKWGNSSWNLNNIGGVAKVWSEASGNYFDINENEIIPSTNGFFIQVNSTTNSITIPASERTHSPDSPNYKTSPGSSETLIATVSNSQNDYFDKSVIGFRMGAMYSYDILYDSRKLFGNAEAPQLYVVSRNEKLSTSYFPMGFSDEVMLFLKPSTSGTFVLQFSNISGFSSETDIILEDRLLNSYQDIKKDSIYPFTANKSDDPDRFRLHFSNASNIMDSSIKASQIYYASDKIYIKGLNNSGASKARLYNNTGQLIMEFKTYDDQIDITNTALTTGIYFVQVEFDSKVINERIFINLEY